MHGTAFITSAIHRGKKEYDSFAPASSVATFAASSIAKSITPAQNSPSYGLAVQWVSHRLRMTKLRPARMAHEPGSRISSHDPAAHNVVTGARQKHVIGWTIQHSSKRKGADSCAAAEQ
jgi:hypothetical protein